MFGRSAEDLSGRSVYLAFARAFRERGKVSGSLSCALLFEAVQPFVPKATNQLCTAEDGEQNKGNGRGGGGKFVFRGFYAVVRCRWFTREGVAGAITGENNAMRKSPTERNRSVTDRDERVSFDFMSLPPLCLLAAAFG